MYPDQSKNWTTLESKLHSLFETVRQPPSSPKHFTVRSIGVEHAIYFNEQWHSRLPQTDKSNLIRNKYCLCFGAEFKDHCFAVAIWTSPVARLLPRNWIELRRLAIADDAPKNTATWMLSKMIKKIRMMYPEVESLVSYQDTSVHSGTIYAAANWEKDAVSSGHEWTTRSRARRPTQSAADKIRWVYRLKESKNDRTSAH